MKTPQKAFILAAGFGTRLLPLTRETPKPLLPIWNVPNLERALAMVRGWGVRDVLVNVHHRAERIVEYLRARRSDELRIAISFEPEILGTGGALRKAEWFFSGEEPVWIVNGDVVADVDPRPILQAYRGRRTIAAAWVHGAAGPRTVDVVRGRIVNFQSARAGAPGTFTFCGVQLVNPALVRRESGFVDAEVKFGSLITAYERAQRAGWVVAGVEVPGSFWADIGTPAQWLAAHRALAGDRDFRAIDPSARIHRGAVVENSIICAGATLGPHARVSNAIVAAGTRVDCAVSYLALPAGAALSSAELDAVRALKWNEAETTALPLGPRGSSRAYTRLAWGPERAILVQYDAARRENALHAPHTRALRSLRIPVPAVRVDRPDSQIAVFEDLGDESLLAWQRGRSVAEVRAMYERVLEIVLRFHERGEVEARRRGWELMPAFRPTLYRWERNYFADEMLRKREQLPEEQIARILRELAGVSKRFAGVSPVLVHRDLQSSNVMICAGRPWLIDYQGMRLGPAVYDLASLLCDPYVELPDELALHFLHYYAARSRSGRQIVDLFWHGAIQRLAQALGAFAKLGSQAGTRAFALHIPAARRAMARALREVSGCAALRAWCSSASEIAAKKASGEQR
ncbi:MAG: sugar phosphate nucleotidyltransferase [Kiritimatiellae bacterium]|nr:sugar phosphate nucleotidyltransferase [Kiritimatiellia bacterium]